MNSSENRIFNNREEAGKELAKKLAHLQGVVNTIVLALPRGGIVPAKEIALEIKSPLDVIISRKIGAPSNPEFGIGAIAEGDVLILNQSAIELHGFTDNQINEIASIEIIEMERRIGLYRSNRPLPVLKDKLVILADDGLATGVTAVAAINSIKNYEPERIIYASPVCSESAAELIKNYADEVVCVICSEELTAIGSYYKEFPQLEDEEVLRILASVNDIR